MIKLAYTTPMAEQDYLWWQELEDVEMMNKLQWDIIKKFLAQHRNGSIGFNVYLENNESIVDVYVTKDERNGEIQNAISCGNCKSLIETIKQLLADENETVIVKQRDTTAAKPNKLTGIAHNIKLRTSGDDNWKYAMDIETSNNQQQAVILENTYSVETHDETGITLYADNKGELLEQAKEITSIINQN